MVNRVQHKQPMKRITAIAALLILTGVANSHAVLLVRELWDNTTNVASNLKGVGNGTTSFGFAGPAWGVSPSTNINLVVDPLFEVFDWMEDVYPMLPSEKDTTGALTLRVNTNGWDSTSYAFRTLATGSRIVFASNSTNYFSARIIKRGLWYSGYGQDDAAVGIGFAQNNTGTGHFVGAGFTRTVAANGGGGYLTLDGSTDIGDTVYITTGTLGQAGYPNHPGDSGGPYYVRAYGPLQEVEGYFGISQYVNGGLLAGRIITTASGNAQMDVRTYVSTDTIDVDPSTVIWNVSYSFTETLPMSQLLVWMHGTNAPVAIDGIRVATTWAEAIGVDIVGPPSVSPTNVVYSGTPATFTAYANIDPADGWYQWLDNGTNIPGSSGFGTNFGSFTLPSPTPADSGSYSLIFSNYYGVAVTSVVQNLTVLLSSSPIITAQPASGIRFATSPSFTMSVTTVGTPPFNYQWKHVVGGITNSLGTQTNQTLVLTNVHTTDAGNYLVTISNGLGSTNSATANLNVLVARPGTYAGTVLGNIPYAYWPMSETNGTVYHDLYNGHDGTAMDPTNMTLGINGAAFAGFDGGHTATFIPNDGHFARVNMPALPGYSNVMTICGWVNTPSAPTINGVLFNRDPNSGGGYGDAFGLEVVGITNIVVGATTNTCGILGYQWGGYTWNSGLVMPVGSWNFVALVLNSTQATIYLGTNSSPLTVGNASLPSATDATFPGGNHSNTNAFYLGRTGWPWAETDPNNAWANVNADMSDVAVFYSALSASNVYNIYISTMGESVTTTNSAGNMVFSWPQGTLQAAGQVQGVYTNIPGAVSPYTTPKTGAQKFYRVQQ